MDYKDVLKECIVEGNIVKLPEGQLDRKLYQEVAKALNLIGGTWKGGKVMGFDFNSDPSELLNEIAGGEKRNLKKEFQFFATPENLANELVEMANITVFNSILEPSAGQGSIIRSINNLILIPDCCELMSENRLMLERSDLRYNLVAEDYLTYTGKKYDRIIANPPFNKGQDIEHVRKMYSDLNSGGRLVTVMSESWVNGSQKKQVAFRDWLTLVNAEILDIERGTFKESGTMVGGKIVIIDK